MRSKEQGFSLLEALVVIIAGGILLASTVSLYIRFMNIHQRQQRVIQVEREMSAIQLSLQQSFTTLAGRELGFYSGTNYAIASLPSISDNSGKPTVNLAIVTPIKVNGYDAIS